MVRKLLPLLLVLIFALPVSAAHDGPQAATTYDFRVEQEIATCDIQKDGSAIISYQITFQNHATIDYVDIGMPNKYYDLSTVSATLYTGSFAPVELSGIKKSSAIECGYEIPIPSQYQTLPYLHIDTSCRVTRMVYPDTENSSYASVEFYPTWWGSFCRGIDFLQTTIIFPANFTDPNATKWHHQTPDWMRIENGRIKFTWNSSGNYEHKYGVSFPRTAVTKVFEPEQPSFWDIFLNDFVFYIPYYCCSYAPFFIVLGIVGFAMISSWRSRMQYLPPSVGVEGMGIKYGLTAPEAAVLLNLPLNKIVNMVFFGMYRKGVISVESRSPLQLRVLRTDYEGLHPYEVGFRAAIKPDGTIDEEILKSATVQLIKDVETKMRGFSRKETANYYRQITKKAWEQVRAAQMDDAKLKILEDNFEWMYMDDKFDRELKRNYGAGYYRTPHWYPFFYPRVAYVAPSPSTRAPAPSPAAPSLPRLPGSDFANQIVSGIQNSANQFVRNVTGFTSGVSEVTNPQPAYSGGTRTGGFGGGGCACACACAGCACACAGGGR
ncbi:MAG: hypothetical protein N3F63_02145 [Thermoplasmata archaeon]|nr:hypothetical protein [Thermoplasmata archaeon]